MPCLRVQVYMELILGGDEGDMYLWLGIRCQMIGISHSLRAREAEQAQQEQASSKLESPPSTPSPEGVFTIWG